jgi:hypothetical protein
MKLSEFNQSVNVIALIVIALGVAISLKIPATGHDMIMAALGALGGTAIQNKLPTMAPSEAPPINA